MQVNADDLKRVRDFIKNNPEKAREIIASSPELIEILKTNNNESGLGQNKSKQYTKAIPGIPKMYEDNGFSNYALLAFIAFIIQLLMTLICIFFYK